MEGLGRGLPRLSGAAAHVGYVGLCSIFRLWTDARTRAKGHRKNPTQPYTSYILPAALLLALHPSIRLLPPRAKRSQVAAPERDRRAGHSPSRHRNKCMVEAMSKLAS